jgi:uncharacterized protein (UPF0335 family)
MTKMKTLLVLIFPTTMVGEFRRLVIESILDHLKAMGYDPDALKAVSHQNLNYLYVNWGAATESAFTKWNALLYERHPENNRQNWDSVHNIGNQTLAFHVEKDLDAFLAEAATIAKIQKEKPIDLKIKGVDVKVTREGVILDYTTLLREVQNEAHKVREAHFGLGE